MATGPQLYGLPAARNLIEQIGWANFQAEIVNKRICMAFDDYVFLNDEIKRLPILSKHDITNLHEEQVIIDATL